MHPNPTVGNQILNKAALFRGIFLNQVTHIEKLIDIRIANHFCTTEDRALEIVDLVFGDRFITFESKRTIYEIIIKKHHPEDYKANKANFQKLTNIQTVRNRLAHLIVSVSEDAVKQFEKDGTLGFVKFKEKTEALYYSPKEQNEILQDTEDIVRWLIF
ncbi:MAG TPA: hypothetical protein VHC47_09995 [Mucilaginibacter sp.]|nr:hypothetical protein [Mucilaginibacter sp.]